jgi:hypothetical protein
MDVLVRISNECFDDNVSPSHYCIYMNDDLVWKSIYGMFLVGPLIFSLCLKLLKFHHAWVIASFIVALLLTFPMWGYTVYIFILLFGGW